MKIFISYSRLDSDLGKAVYNYLDGTGHEVFIDTKKIAGGEEWEEIIKTEISKCDRFVLILTLSSINREEVKKEIDVAIDEKKKIIPCIHSSVEIKKIPLELKKYNGVQFEEGPELGRKLFAMFDIEEKEGTKDTESIVKELEINQNNARNELEKIRSDFVKFDLDIPADRLLFYLRFLENLTNSNETFIKQNSIQYVLANKLSEKHYPINSTIGYDELFYNAHSQMNDEEREMFDFLRRTTEDSKLFNSYAKRLLQDNIEIFKDMPELKLLYEHYSYWLAKYELLKNDPDMCLVYVGPKQKKRFPVGIESRINEKIKALREETLMQDLP